MTPKLTLTSFKMGVAEGQEIKGVVRGVMNT